MVQDVLCIHCGTKPFGIGGPAQLLVEFQEVLTHKWPDLYTHVCHNVQLEGADYYDFHTKEVRPIPKCGSNDDS